MSKFQSRLITALFCIYIFGFGIAQFLLPDRTFSEQENRYLTQFQAPTLSTLKDGSFMTSFENYIIDQFPLRDKWIQMKAQSERLIGKQENNKVYLGVDGQTLFTQFQSIDASDLQARVEGVNTLADNVSVPVYFSIIPDKTYVWANRLPGNAPNVDDGSTALQAQALCSDKVHWIDLYQTLQGIDVFYRTDHHWSTMGAYQAYQTLAQAMNGACTTLDISPTLVSDGFYGTTWSSSGAGWVRPDEMYTWVPESGLTGSTTVTWYHTSQPEAGKLYDTSYLEKKDKYSMFLGGNQPLAILRNPDAQGGRLLVVRDSYSDSLAPFLSLDYQEVHLYDLRYNRLSLKQYIEEHQIDQVLVLYSVSNFTTDNNLALLKR